MKTTRKTETKAAAWNCQHCRATNVHQGVCGCRASRIAAGQNPDAAVISVDSIVLFF